MLTSLLIAACYVMICSGVTAAQDRSPDADRWDSRYEREMYVYGKEPIQFLKDHVDGLRRGTALCMAAGEGRNAVYLAQKGFDVTAVDISQVGLRKAERLAGERGVTITTVAADLSEYDLGTRKWDLITNIYYYEPDLFPKVVKALKPGGAFLFETFSLDNPAIADFGPRNPDYLAKPLDLLGLAPDLRLRHYEDRVVELHDGMHKGKGAVIRMIAQKPE